jgi:short-subunit dehydrogenase
VAVRFAKAYPVVVLARKQESYSGIVSEIEQAGGKAFGISADAADPASIKSAFETIKKELPDSKLAAAIFNVSAGFAVKPFLDLSLSDLDDSLNAAV